MTILALESSVSLGSVAVIRDGSVLAEEEVAMRGAHEERLMPAVAAALARADVAPRELTHVLCGGGPGSFTSLRIAAAIAKGIAVAAGAMLCTLPSSLLMLAAHAPLGEGRYLTALDAMREECFLSLYAVDAAGHIVALEAPAIAAREDVARLASHLGATTIGPGATIDARPHARGAALIGRAFEMPPPVDIDSWEPDYGRLAEAQVRWERVHGRPLSSGEIV